MGRLAGRVMLLWGWPRRFAAFLAGAVATLALAPLDFPAACFIAFPVLVWLLDGQASAGGLIARLLPAFSVGWWFGFGYFLSSMWWVGAPLFGNADRAWALPFAVFGLPALLAFFYGLATLAARFLWSDGVGRIAALGFGFGLAEWLRSTVLFGFSWNAVGYAIMPVPLLMQAGQVIGIAGVSALAVFVFSAPALIGTRLHASTGLVLAALFLLAQTGYGYYRLSTAPDAERFLEVRLVQPAIGGGLEERFNSYVDLSGSPVLEGGTRPQVILWPELAAPFVLAERPALLDAMSALVAEGQTLVAGTIRSEGGGGGEIRLYNALVTVTGDGIADASDKVRLLPFVDYSPFDVLPRMTSEFSAGSGRRLLAVADGVVALPLVGTEATVPHTSGPTAPSADIIVNPARHTAFPGSLGPHQHLRQAQLRAVEAGLPMLVVLPEGPSAAIDAYGRIIAGLAIGARGTLDMSVPLMSNKLPWNWNRALAGFMLFAILGLFALSFAIAARISNGRN